MIRNAKQQYRTIAEAAVTMMRVYERHEADVVVAAVRGQFPKSKFNRDHFHYYHSMLQRGMVDRRGRRRPS